eukprot:58144-Pelagomonas_calceolata.AAC.1
MSTESLELSSEVSTARITHRITHCHSKWNKHEKSCTKLQKGCSEGNCDIELRMQGRRHAKVEGREGLHSCT